MYATQLGPAFIHFELTYSGLVQFIIGPKIIWRLFWLWIKTKFVHPLFFYFSNAAVNLFWNYQATVFQAIFRRRYFSSSEVNHLDGFSSPRSLFLEHPRLMSWPNRCRQLYLPDGDFLTFLAIFLLVVNRTLPITTAITSPSTYSIDHDIQQPLLCHHWLFSAMGSVNPFARVRIRPTFLLAQVHHPLPSSARVSQSMPMLAHLTQPTSLINLKCVGLACSTRSSSP